jgi:hypothetical protein
LIPQRAENGVFSAQMRCEVNVMAHDFIPSREAELLNWSRNFREQISAAPGSFGLTPPQAAAYAALDDAYAAAFALARSPNTNSKANIVAKNSAKTALKAYARMLARLVRATPGVTNDQRGQLGLTVPDTDLTPVRRPSDPPVLMLRPSIGRVVRIRLRDKIAPTRRGKPPGVAGAAVFSCVAEMPLTRLADWSFEGNATRPLYEIDIDGGVPAGARVWIAAYWYNTRGKCGPLSSPIAIRVQDGVGRFGAAAA